jgi:hypothetical protein
LLGQSVKRLKERWRLADKNPHRREESKDSLGNALWIRRANHSTNRQFRADEFAGNGEDQVSLQRGVKRLIEVREGQPRDRISERSNWRLHAVAREIHPLHEVGYFVSANADENSENLQVGGLLDERGVKGAATLLNRSKVKSRRVGNSLNVVFRLEIRIG